MRQDMNKRLMVLLLSAVAALLPLHVSAQTYYTLTNGHVYWYDNPTWLGESYESRQTELTFVGTHESYTEVYEYGGNYLKNNTEHGDIYAALDITDVNDPKVVPATVFGPKCLWQRSSVTGYYFQVWDGNRYYLIGGRTGLKVVKVAAGQPTEELTLWYNWDFGAAVKEVTYRDLARVESYYWLMYDTTGTAYNEGQWTMSCNSYERPDALLYSAWDNNATQEVNDLNKGWFCSRTLSNGTKVKSGAGAVVLPVEATTYGRENTTMPDDLGFKGLSVVEPSDHTTPVNSMKFLDVKELKLDVRTTNENRVGVTPPYTQYHEELDRYGIHTYWRMRVDDEFGSAGVPSYADHYYYPDEENGPDVWHANPPDEVLGPLSVDSVIYSLPRTAQRYFSLSVTRTVGAPDPEHPVTIHCYNVPSNGMSVEIAAIVYFSNGTAARQTCTITASQEVAHADFPTPTKGPVIRGYLVGGGRVANVGYDAGNYTNNIISGGNTSITVHSCDSIYAIYGGNDIAGWVQGHATLQLGTAFTSAAHPVHIGYVYGGGCGYYAYQNAYDALAFAAGDEPWAGSDVLSDNLNYGQYCFRGDVYPWHTPSSAIGSVTPVATGFDYHPYDGTGGYDFNFAEKGQSGSGSIPYIKSSHIIVGVNVDALEGADEEETAALRAAQTARNNHILIDSLFGGAENAFIGVTSNELTPANGVTIDINGGTIYSVFGGNNYGGSVAATATVFVHVHNTKLPTGYNVPFVPSLEDGEVVFTEGDGYYQATDSSYFDGYGREYGIRYLFGGGNLVDGTHANVQITGGMIDTCYLGGNRATVTRPIGEVNCTGGNFICTNPSYDTTLLRTILGSDEYFGPKSWTGELGNYNIRCLFGGNNKAKMETLAVIQLTSGGVSCVYGGGNAGDMVHRGGLTLPQFVPIMNQTMQNTDGNVPWPTNIGSIVYTPQDSRIKCDYIFGGCRMANVWGSCGVVLKGGMFGYVNGGNDVSGDVGSTSWKVDASGDSVGDASVGMRDGAYVHLDNNVIVVGDLVGGSDGYYHCDNGKGYYEDSPLYDTYSGENYDPYDEHVGRLLPTHNNTYVSIKGGVVKGNVIAGGVHANVGFDEDVSRNHILLDGVVRPLDPQGGTKNGSIHLNMNGGVVEGDVFGGGYMSTVYGLSYIHIGGTAVIKGSLFAGNDLVGAIEGFGAYTDSLPNAASYEAYKASNNIPLNMNDGSWSAVFSSYALIDGTPRIGCVYGGGNGAYNYDGNRPEYGDQMVSICDDGRAVTIPLQSSSFVDINLDGNSHEDYPGEPCIDTVFGGGNGAGVRERVIVLLNCATNDNRMVGTIFGGNNRDDMASCVPNIMLNKGRVGDVFGGGNMGAMNGSGTFSDTCGNEVTGVSTHIRIDNDNAIIDGTVYGGCRMAEVGGMAYVEIRGGTVNNVFGGNDISGTVSGNTRIDISGGTVRNIHGGSNGKYDYDYVDGAWDVYTFQSATHNAATLQVKGTSGRPFVDSTTVNLYGGTITTDVFGGGALGDCRATNVIVNDKICPAKITTPDLTITGTLYAGGEGYWQDLNQPRYGNVLTTDDNTAACYLHLHHATYLRDASGFAKAYGGGKGGDVENTYVYSYPTWNIPFQALYGGCWGSDVFMSTHMDLQGGDVGEAQTANNVYGGNDFTGSVGKTEITVRNGKYGFIYGGGNGDYPEGYYTGAAGTVGGVDYSVYAGNYSAADAQHGFTEGVAKRLYEPNNEYAEINFLDGTVDSNMFGGGKMGTTMRYKRDAQGAWLTHGGGASKVPDTFRSLTDGGGDPIAHTPANAALVPDTSEAYSYIIINVHGGTFEHNIYAGGAGKAGGNWIVYGLKELNIDGGLVKESVYGGSENVNDGYPRECQTTTNTNLRPSSIINLTGGTIKNHVYGGGYLGDVHGSVYVNVGLEAVNNCPVWTRDIFLGKDGSGNDVVDEDGYAKFKPGNSVWGKVRVPALTANELQLQASIYGGANWGNNVGNADFSKAGFYGGESRICVDGEGYNTYMDDAHGSLPLMNIVNSIIGAGTSADGGDVYNRIDVRNYGAVNNLCQATRQLRAIQRADAVWLENTAIDYTGSTDAISAYLSEQYTINRVDTLNCVGYNVVDVDATMTNIGCVNFLYTKEYSDELLSYYGNENDPSTPMLERNTTWFEPSLQYMYVPKGMMLQASACADNATTCDKLHDFNRELDEYSFSAIVANNGINIDFIGENGEYSAIKGYGYLISEQGTNAVVTARSKYHDHNEDDGGFYSSCTKDMMAVKDNSTEVIEWCEECFLEDGSRNTTSPDYPLYCYNGDPDWLNDLFEYRYDNYGTQYRMWTIGNGIRRRYAVIQAHSNPDSLYTVVGLNDTVRQNKKITLWDTTSTVDSLFNLSIAKATLRLPPTVPGHYYKISNAGVEINDENAEMHMTDVSYLPKNWDNLSNKWKVSSSREHRTAPADVQGTNYEADANGSLQRLRLEGLSGSLTGINMIEQSTGNQQYFGLMMSSGANFAVDGSGNLERPATIATGGTWTGGTTLSGNKNTNILTNFTTAQVGATLNTMPELDLYLLYNNEFSHTMLGTVTFTLEEYESVHLRENYNPEVGISSNTGEEITAAAWYAANHEAHPTWVQPATDYLDNNIHAPIEVEITITTILQDFKDMEYEVLAMYNEGRLDHFDRKIILPATLQRRELYLRGISWFPTNISNGYGNGDTLRTDSNPDHFYLTNSTAVIKGQTPSSAHSYFGMSILPMDNISNTLVTAVGWHTISANEPVNLYTTVADQLGWEGSTVKRVSSNDQTHYYQEATEPTHFIDTVQIGSNSDPGLLLGVLDGRGEAAIKVSLDYDGNRIYDKIPGKGYVGKVVLTLVSYSGGDHSHGNYFHLIINVKTRDRGDTIYLASAATVTRDGTTLNACNDFSAESITNGAGKKPSKYVRSFYDAFTKVYQEGDVIAIIDEVNINDQEGIVQTLIKGEEYMPVNVIRYTGSHHDLPGNAGAYRGPMIVVDGANASLTARCITFQGGMMGKVHPKNTTEQTAQVDAGFLQTYDLQKSQLDPKYTDTTKAYGPIIEVRNHGTVNLQNNTTVEYNYNGYGSQVGDDPVAHPELMGAISVTDNGKLNLVNNVTIEHNLSDSLAGSACNWHIQPLNGAVYVDGGTVTLLEANSSTAVTIKDNFLNKTGVPYWQDQTIEVDLNPDPDVTNLATKATHTEYHPTNYIGTNTARTRANVWLARTEPTVVPDEITALGAAAIQAYKDTVDVKSATIVFNKTVPENTRIGISKWFPDCGEALRDTMQAVFQADATHLVEAETNENFFSDNGYFIFYEYGVNNQRMFLGRCASFRFQHATEPASLLVAGSGIYTGDALSYAPLTSATCPTGGDQMVMRAQGGFYPYTYRWEDGAGTALRTRKTSHSNLEVNKGIATSDFAPLRDAVSDTYTTDRVEMAYSKTDSTIVYHVTVTDATDHCTLTKNVKLHLVKDITGTLSIANFFTKTHVNAIDAHWNDAVEANQDAWTEVAYSTPNAVGDTARGDRKYPAVTITPKVWTSGSGTVAAAIIDRADSNYIYYSDDEGSDHYLGNLALCEGDVIRLATSPTFHLEDDVDNPEYNSETHLPKKRVYDSKFVMWDFDPYYSNPVTYVVPAQNTTVIAYYGPLDYWIDVIDAPAEAGAVYDNNNIYTTRPTPTPAYSSTDGSAKAGYVTTYNGDVHIYDENGLAWFISVVNGLNGTQARPFYFNNVYLHKKSDATDYDMKDHLWTPVGTIQHRFRGRLIGVGTGETDTTRLASPNCVVVKNIIVDEPHLENTGFFAWLDSATIASVELQGALVRGSQYVGTLAARSVDSKINNCYVESNIDGATTTILTTHHTSGGMIGKSENDIITNSSIKAKYVGDAVYSGGVVGYGTNSTITNTHARNDEHMEGLYIGGLAGWLDGDAPYGAKSGHYSVAANNYVHLITDGRSQRVGGLVGYATNSLIENNYVHGTVVGSATEGGVGAVLDDGSLSDHNYFEQKAVGQAVGQRRGTAVMNDNTDFSGSGNQVQIGEANYGVNNLTRVLNLWVKQHGSEYKSWRSDLTGDNYGYPLYGEPDLIPVHDEFTYEGCDSIEWDGLLYNESVVLSSHVIDSVLMIDSTATLTLLVHHSVSEQYSDTVDAGQPYSGYGFELSATETRLLRDVSLRQEPVTLILTDTLVTVNGCDSVITLALTLLPTTGVVVADPNHLKVYPNPTTSRVTIETEGLTHVELYDNEGRRLQDYTTGNKRDMTIDVSTLPTGVYYLRIHTTDGVTIQKLIKK